MENFFNQYHPVMQALIATLFTYGMTATGALPVFFTEKINQKLVDSVLGFSAGVMMASS